MEMVMVTAMVTMEMVMVTAMVTMEMVMVTAMEMVRTKTNLQFQRIGVSSTHFIEGIENYTLIQMQRKISMILPKIIG